MNWWNSLTDLQRLMASIAAPATLFMVLQFILTLLGFVHGGDVDSADHGDADLQDGLHEGLDGHDLADGHSHDIFSGHGHDLADGHDHSIFDGHGHDLADGHDHDIFGAQAHSHDSAHGETADHSKDGHDSGDAMRLFTLRGIIAFLAVGGWMGVAAIDWKLPDILAVILGIAAGWLALWFVAWIIHAFVKMQQSGNIRVENAVGKDGDVYLTIPENGRGKVNVIVQDRLCEMDAVTKAGRAIKTGEKITVVGVTPEGALVVAPKAPQVQKDLPEREKIPG